MPLRNDMVTIEGSSLLAMDVALQPTALRSDEDDPAPDAITPPITPPAITTAAATTTHGSHRRWLVVDVLDVFTGRLARETTASHAPERRTLRSRR
jgi:hypothetical protein